MRRGPSRGREDRGRSAISERGHAQVPVLGPGAIGERGQALVLVLGLGLLVFAISGLAVDGTRAFLARRSLQNTADAAALAGAGEIDTDAYYRSRGRKVVLDPAAARSAAQAWLERRGLPVRASITAGSERVLVAVRSRVPTTFLGLVGISALPVAALATAEAVAGAP
jgi:Flp pilus assembly protein TadG